MNLQIKKYNKNILKRIYITVFTIFTFLQINSILNKIYVYSIFDIYSLITCLHSLKEKSRLVIFIDSLPALYLSFVYFNNNDGKFNNFK